MHARIEVTYCNQIRQQPQSIHERAHLESLDQQSKELRGPNSGSRQPDSVQKRKAVEHQQREYQTWQRNIDRWRDRCI